MATANGTVAFEAVGVSRSLRFTTNALCLLEDKTGSNVLQIGSELAFGVSMVTLRAMFWAGCDASLTPEQAGEMIDAVGIARARALAADAFEAAFPVAEASDGENPLQAAG